MSFGGKRAKLVALRNKINVAYNASVSSPGKPKRTRRFSAGSIAADYVLGISEHGEGGFPVGVVTGLVGWEGSGKTTLALKGIADCQARCARCYDYAKNIKEEKLLDEAGNPVLDDEGDEIWHLTGECDCYAKDRWEPHDTPTFKTKKEEAAYNEELEELKKNSFEPMIVVYLDAENALDTLWARKQRVKLKVLEHVIPGYAEQAIDIVEEYITSGAVDLIVVDSLAAFVPKIEREASTEDQQRGAAARLVNKAVRKWVGAAAEVAMSREHRRMVTQVWIQQWRNTMQSSFSGKSKTMPGGNGQRFAYSIIVDVWKSDVEEIEIEELKVLTKNKEGVKAAFAHRTNMTSKKNKTWGDRKTASFRMATLDIDALTAGEVLETDSIFKIAMSFGLIERAGSTYTFRGKKFKNQSAIRALIADKPAIREWTRREIMKALYVKEVNK